MPKILEQKPPQLTGPEIRGKMGKAGLTIEALAGLLGRAPRTVAWWRDGRPRCCQDAERELRRVLREYGG